MKKTISFLLVIFLFAHTSEEQPAKRQKTEHAATLSFIAADGSIITAPKNIAPLSSYISSIVDADSDTVNLQPFHITTSTLSYYLECLKRTANGIETQKKSKDFPSFFLLQRIDGKIISKNILPIIKEAIANISEEDFINLIKLAQFTSVYFLLNALCHIYVQQNYAAKSYEEFKQDTEKLTKIFGERAYRFMKKHAYIQKKLPWPTNSTPYEMSIGDYITLYPKHALIPTNRRFDLIDTKDIENEKNNTQLHITALEGLNLLNLTSTKIINIQSDFLVPYYYDPLFPPTPFAHAGSTHYLKITDTKLFSLPAEFLSGLDSLEELNLDNTKLIWLDKDIFFPVAKTIGEIYLKKNEIGELDPEIFYQPSVHDLTKVYLKNNPICAKINDGMFHLKPAEIENYTYIDCHT